MKHLFERRVLTAMALLLAAAMLLSGCSDKTASSLQTSSATSSETVAEDVPLINVVTSNTTSELKNFYGINDDFIGIFSIPALGLSENCVVSPDNDYYLRRDIYGNYRHLGILFFDYRNLHDGIFGQNTILYGHNIGKRQYSDEMFGKLVKYREGNTYLTADVFKFKALNGYTYYFKLFSGYPSEPYAYGDQYFFMRTDFNENKSYHYTDMRRYEDFTSFIASLKQKSDFKTDTDVRFYDKILTLVTCIYDKDDYRYVLHAKLMHTDEVQEYLTAHPDFADAGEIIGNPQPY